MSEHEKSRPLGKGGSPENDASNVTSQGTAREWDFVQSTPVNAGPFFFEDHGYVQPCGEFEIWICGSLRQRLERAARSAGVAPETMITAILSEVLEGAS
ncbi:hypothetical protein ABZ357_21385 [Streptomyces sp. NPDC005917]|uniref:hypothetical protein n=1 Tax=unclassified Streptomyces TaxID=2593676 RepID=UPI0033FB8357